MTFKDEKEFEAHVRNLITLNVASPSTNFRLLKANGIADIVICREGIHPAIYFIELKYESRSLSGQRNQINVTEGIQTEILKNRPDYMENHLMWLLGSQECEGGYWFISSKQLSAYITPNSANNNIDRETIFRGKASEQKMSEADLVKSLELWISQVTY